MNTGSVYLEQGWLRLLNGSQSGMDDLSAFTIECDFRPELLRLVSTPDLIAKWGATNPEQSYRLQPIRSPTNTFRLDTYGTGGSGTVSGAAVWVMGSWYHLAATFDAGAVKLYLNGQEVASTSVSTTHIQASSSDVHIGEDTGLAAFDGYVDNFRFWNVARTPEQIDLNREIEMVGNEAGLVCCVQFNIADDYSDETANNNDFAEVAGAEFSTVVPWGATPAARAIPGGLIPGGIGLHV